MNAIGEANRPVAKSDPTPVNPRVRNEYDCPANLEPTPENEVNTAFANAPAANSDPLPETPFISAFASAPAEKSEPRPESVTTFRLPKAPPAKCELRPPNAPVVVAFGAPALNNEPAPRMPKKNPGAANKEPTPNAIFNAPGPNASAENGDPVFTNGNATVDVVVEAAAYGEPMPVHVGTRMGTTTPDEYWEPRPPIAPVVDHNAAGSPAPNKEPAPESATETISEPARFRHESGIFCNHCAIPVQINNPLEPCWIIGVWRAGNRR